MRLSERQWELIRDLFPEPKQRRDGRGRPWASNRQCVEGILWVLRTGARWRDLPAEYPSGVTCWRRLRRWEDEGVWLEAWQQLLAALNQQQLLKEILVSSPESSAFYTLGSFTNNAAQEWAGELPLRRATQYL